MAFRKYTRIVFFVSLWQSSIGHFTAFAQQQSIHIQYKYQSLEGKKARVIDSFCLNNDTLIFHDLQLKRGEFTKIKIRKQSFDSIVWWSKRYPDSSIFVENKCAISNEVHRMRFQLTGHNVSLEMKNTLTPNAYVVLKVVQQYMPKSTVVSYDKTYVYDAWDCDMLLESKAISEKMARQLIDTLCSIWVEENKNKPAVDKAKSQRLSEDPVSGALFVESTHKLAFEDVDSNQQQKKLNSCNFPLLPLADTTFIFDSTGVLSKNVVVAKAGKVFVFGARKSLYNSRRNIVLRAFQLNENNVTVSFSIPNHKFAYYGAEFNIKGKMLEFIRDGYTSNRFELSCRDGDPFYHR